MPPLPKFAVLLDGGFVIKKLQQTLKRFPTADDIEAVCGRIKEHVDLQDRSLLRIYFYHAPPCKEVVTNPLNQSVVNLAATPIHAQHESLLDALELRADFALRLGETVVSDWRLGTKAMRSLLKQPRAIQAPDLVPNISQKGVDLRIGLDIARLALRSMVELIVVVTGDSDLIPAFKFARREGLRVYLLTLGHGAKRDLKAHADRVLTLPSLPLT